MSQKYEKDLIFLKEYFNNYFINKFQNQNENKILIFKSKIDKNE